MFRGRPGGKRQEVRAGFFAPSVFACSATGAGSSSPDPVVALGAVRLRSAAAIAPAAASRAEMPAAMRQPFRLALSGPSRCADECSAAATLAATVCCTTWPVPSTLGARQPLAARAGQRGDDSAHVTGQGAAAYQARLLQLGDLIGQAALGGVEGVRQVGHPQLTAGRRGEPDEDLVLRVRQAGLLPELLVEAPVKQ